MMKKVKQNLNKFWKSEYAPFGFFAISIFVIILKMNFQDGDDMMSIQQLSQMSPLKWVYWRATTWQPRISADLAVSLVNFNKPLWKLNTAVLSTVLVMSISYLCTMRITNKEEKKNMNLLICCSFFFISPNIITACVFWCTGSYYYLWSAVALILALMPFIYAIQCENIKNKKMYIVYFIASAYASYIEQPFAILLCFGMFTFIYLLIKKIKIDKALILQYIFILLNVGIYFSFGGESIRTKSELFWYRDYTMLSFVDKIFQGVNWSNYQLMNSSNILMCVFTGIIAVTIWKKNSDKIVRFFSSIPFALTILSILPIDMMFSNVSYLQDPYTGEISHLNIAQVIKEGMLNCMSAGPNNFNLGIVNLAPSIVCLTVILFITALLYFVFEKFEDRIIAIILYLAALASSYIISFTPTIFASRYRVFFITDVLILLLIGMVMQELLKFNETFNKRIFITVKFIIIIMAAIFITEQFAFIWSGRFRQ